MKKINHFIDVIKKRSVRKFEKGKTISVEFLKMNCRLWYVGSLRSENTVL